MPLFSGLSFEVNGGELLQVSGPNGSGKSSLLRILAGLAAPESGSVSWRDAAVDATHAGFAADIRYLGHANGVKAELTARENLEFDVRLCGANAPCTLPAALAAVGLSALSETPARNMSAGQRRRLALARLLRSPAALWVLDEPFTSLDADGRRMVEQLLADHVRAGKVAVVAGHDRIEAGVNVKAVRLG